MSSREQFEAVVIERFKASGYLPEEIRTELLQRSGDDYHDGSVSAYWHFWQAARQALEITLPSRSDIKYMEYFPDVEGGIFNERAYLSDFLAAIESAGVRVNP